MGITSGSAQALLDKGVESTKVGRFGKAGQHFLQALEIIESQPEGDDKSKELGITAELLFSTGHPDLALMALQGLLESKERKSDPAKHCGDLLTLANSWNRLGRSGASSIVNEQVLDLAFKHGRFADAASASTNLASNYANSGRLPKALKHLQESLEYLKKESNLDTDAITRITLIQVVDAMGAEPEIALDASTDLFTRLIKYVGPERWEFCQVAFHRLVDRYLQAHPELDADTWKKKTFPLAFGEG